MAKKILIYVFAAAAFLYALDLRIYEPKQITTDPSKESDIVIKDENTLYFASDRGGSFDVYKKDLLKESVARITFQPSNEYPKYYEKKLLMESDETDIHGNLYFLAEDGKQELIYSTVGREKSPFIFNGKVYFSEDYRGRTGFKYFDPGSKKKPKAVRGDIGGKALFSGKNELLFQSVSDESGYNNLFIADIKKDEASEPVQITFGQKIVTGFDVSKDGNTVIYSAVTTDTNGDSKIDLWDNSILFRINRSEGYFSDPVQLTPESYSSFDPKLSEAGKIYYISDRKGNQDIWVCGINGVAPMSAAGYDQIAASDFILEKYKAESLLSQALNEKLSEQTLELLSMALISYNRCMSYSDISDEARAVVYFKIAEIYRIQKKYAQEESVYRIIQSRYEKIEDIAAQAELGRASAELIRRGISTSVLGYELDEHLRYLTGLTEKYNSATALNQIYIRIGEIYQNLGRHAEANGYFLKAIERAGGVQNPESYFRQAKSAFADGNFNAGAELLNTAINSAYTDELKEKYIREYFAFPGLEKAEKAERVSGIISNETLPAELRSFANYIMAGLSDDPDEKIIRYGESRKLYVSDPANALLQKFSAMADLDLARLYTGTRQEEAAEGVLKYMIRSYPAVSYGIYSSVAEKILSEIYLKNAAAFTARSMYDNALFVYTKAFELDRTNIEVIRGIADSYSGLNRIDEAVRFFTPFYESNINSAHLNYALGYIYSIRGASPARKSLGDIGLAIRLLNRSLELDSSIKYTYLTLSFCYEAAYQISLTQAESDKDKNIVLKGLDFVTGPLKFVLETVNLIEDDDIDYTDTAISILNRGLSVCDPVTDRDIYLKLRLNLANNYYNMGEYARKQALDNYVFVLDSGYVFGSERQKAVVYERTGHCMFTVEGDRAEEYYDKAAAVYRSLNDRPGELRVSMRTALLYLTKEDDEGDLIAGDDAYQKYSDILIKLKSEDNRDAINLILRNSAFARFIDSEYGSSAGILKKIIDSGAEYKDRDNKDNFIILSLFGLDIPVWKLELVLGSQFAEGFEGKDELALLYAIRASSYAGLKDFGPVKKMLSEMAEIFEKKDNRLALSLLENRLGVIEYFTGNWKESIKIFSKSEELCLKLGLNNSALANRNNILKASLKAYGKEESSKTAAAASDTAVYSIAFPVTDIVDKAVFKNLSGALYYKLYRQGKDGSPGERYDSFRNLIKAGEMFFEADTLLSSQPRTNEEKNRLTAAVLYNRSSVLYESGRIDEAAEVLNRSQETASLTYDKLLHWRIRFKSGDLETDPEKKLTHYIEAEKILSSYLPSTEDYELISGWQEDIRPLYDRLILAHIEKEDHFAAFNYAERYKNRTLLNYYSSRHLDYREQLHKIHVKKIRYNNEEIVRYRQRSDMLRNRNPEKFAKLIEEYEKQADFYEKELTDIYAQIRRSNDERLLQFVGIEDINREAVADELGEYKALISIYRMENETLFFYLDENGVTLNRSKAAGTEEIFNGLADRMGEKEQIFIVPDPDAGAGINYTALSKKSGIEGAYFTLLPNVSSLKMVSENANINFSVLKTASEIEADITELSSSLEDGGVLYFDKPVKINRTNALETEFTVGKEKIKLGEFLRLKLPAYAVVIGSFEGGADDLDRILIANSFIFSGVSTIIMPDQNSDAQDMSKAAQLIFSSGNEKNIPDILSDAGTGCVIYGLTGMNRSEQKEFASSNLKNSLVNAVRFYNSGVFEKASVFFLQALSMARNIGDKQELNILKTLSASLSKMKDYKRAVIYGEQLASYSEKNGLEKEKISAWDLISKDHFRNKDYDKSADYQLKIIGDGSAGQKEKLAAYDMLSVIYSYKGDLKRSIAYKKEFMAGSGLIGSEGITSFGSELDTKASEVLFNSLRNILVSYYKNGETDSALFVYDTIMKNREYFDDINEELFGDLYESAGLCYFGKSEYGKAREMYFEAIEYFSDEAKTASVQLNLADLYYYTDKLTAAMEYLSEAEKRPLTPAGLVRLYNTRSLIEVKSGNLPAARTYSYKALEKTIEIGDRSEESTARVNLAKILIEAGDIESAKRNLSASVRLANETKNLRALISARFYAGEIFLNTENQPDSALSAYKICLNLSISGNDELFKSRAYFGIGSAYTAKGNADSSTVYLHKSMENSDRFGFNDVYLRSGLKLAGIYERSSAEKSLSLLNMLTDRAVKIESESENLLPGEFEPVISEVFENRISLLLRLSRTDETLAAAELKDRFFGRNDRKFFETLKAEALTENSGIKEAIRSSLDDKTAVIFFFGTGRIVSTVILTAGGEGIFETEMTGDISGLPAKIDSRGDVLNQAKKAHDAIFSRGAGAILTGMNRIVIYSSGTMKNYPFDALYDGKEFLIDKYGIAELNTLAGFKFAEQTGSFGRSLSFVNPFTAESELVFSEREFGALEFLSGGAASLTGRQASESVLKSADIKKYRMIHLPVHSFVLSKDSLRTNGRSSYIQLSADDKNDGRLEWNEIASLDVAGREVILSGCDTGGKTGREYYRHFDLSQAFADAGAPVVVSSRWKTDDLAASVLMKRYFRYTSSGLDRITALSKAKRDVRQFFNPHPYYWANFKMTL
jgi:tetratricopeptide (TPR) repeat protein